MNFFKRTLLIALSVLALNAQAQNKVKYYFNHPVDVSVSAGVNAINLNGAIDDTLIAYINRSKYTLDLAIYDFTSYSSSSLSAVANAINAAYARGVRVRLIDDGSSSNSGVALLTAAIPRVSSPTSSGYGIMHNKFMIVDGYSPNPDESIVWTGSTNWSVEQFNSDYDNIVIFQDSALAHAYIDEFNMMWGDTGAVPNAANARFGSHKTDLGRHNFVIDGHLVELYFSPSDGTNNHILSSINSADKDLYIGVYTFTYSADANAIVARKNAGVYTAGIIDQFSNYSGNNAYTTISTNLGSNFREYTGSYIYHNKYMIVDPSDACSDPQVLTGSHNWSSSANTQNDENTVIIHDGYAANIYYQSFRGDFEALGGTLSVPTGGCPTGIADVENGPTDINIAPNPANGEVSVSYDLKTAQRVSIMLVDMAGRSDIILQNESQNAGNYRKIVALPAQGIYMLKVVTEKSSNVFKVINGK